LSVSVSEESSRYPSYHQRTDSGDDTDQGDDEEQEQEQEQEQEEEEENDSQSSGAVEEGFDAWATVGMGMVAGQAHADSVRTIYFESHPVRIVTVAGVGGIVVVVAKDLLMLSGISKENVARTTKSLTPKEKFKLAVPSSYCNQKGQHAMVLTKEGLLHLLKTSRRLRKSPQLSQWLNDYVIPQLT